MTKMNRTGKVIAFGMAAMLLLLGIGVWSMFALADIHFHDTYFELTWPW